MGLLLALATITRLDQPSRHSEVPKLCHLELRREILFLERWMQILALNLQRISLRLALSQALKPRRHPLVLPALRRWPAMGPILKLWNLYI